MCGVVRLCVCVALTYHVFVELCGCDIVVYLCDSIEAHPLGPSQYQALAELSQQRSRRFNTMCDDELRKAAAMYSGQRVRWFKIAAFRTHSRGFRIPE